MANKQELVRFLDRRVFDPILKASPSSLSKSDKGKLLDAQKRTRSEKDRFHQYDSAQQFIENYKRDLNAPAAKHVNSELQKLNLPTLPSVKDEFMKIAET
jgi:hypothetical protein